MEWTVVNMLFILELLSVTGYINIFMNARRIKIIPLTQAKLNGALRAIFAPMRQPPDKNTVLVMSDHRNTNNPFALPIAAPNPTARPSRERPRARDAASALDILFDLSMSASSGSAYNDNIKRKLNA